MTDWTARIDALPYTPERDVANERTVGFWQDLALARGARLALAAERLREPHGHNCRALWSLTAPDCTCGKDRDMLRILEAK